MSREVKKWDEVIPTVYALLLPFYLTADRLAKKNLLSIFLKKKHFR